MKLKIVLLALVAVLAAPTLSGAYLRPPGVTKPIAEREARSLLQKVGTWRYATDRYLDCRRGKINRIRWACRVGWYKGRVCRMGRIQVYGFLQNGEQWFGARGKLSRCISP